MDQTVNVLVLGGTGFVGRNLVRFLCDTPKVKFIRVVDKVFPQTAFLSESHNKCYEQKNCVFVQGNLTNAASIAKCYTMDNGEKFDWVFNCAAETKYGQDKPIYKEKTYDLTIKVAEEAVKQNIKKFIHLSNAQVYKSSKKPADEKASLDPWTLLAESQLEAEKALQKMSGLNLIILRPAIIYGPGDTNGVAPRVICAAVYKKMGKKMKFLWSADLKMNTVHVNDVVAAMWFAANELSPGALYNLCDKNDTTQEKINSLLEKIFGIETGFHGSVKSNLASAMGMKDIAEQANDDHLKPWSDLCKEHNVVNTPLSPYIDPELFYNIPFCVDGSAIESKGFKYKHPVMTEELVREIITYYSKQGLFPGFS